MGHFPAMYTNGVRVEIPPDVFLPNYELDGNTHGLFAIAMPKSFASYLLERRAHFGYFNVTASGGTVYKLHYTEYIVNTTRRGPRQNTTNYL